MRSLRRAIWVCGLAAFLLLSCQTGEESVESTRTFRMAQIYWVPNDVRDDPDIVPKGVGLALDFSEIILMQSPWSPSIDSIQKLSWVSELTKTHDRGLAIALDWMRQDRKGLVTDEGLSWSFRSQDVRNRFIDDTFKIAKAFRPQYLLLGVEVDFLARNHPDEFKAFSSTYAIAYDRIKKTYPDIRVLVSFQYEMSTQDLNPPEQFEQYGPVSALLPKLDLLGISAYPCQLASSVSEILPNHFSALANSHLKVGFFETAWPGGILDLTEQREYLAWMFHEANALHAEIVVWTSTTDLSEPLESRRASHMPRCTGHVADWNSELGLWTRRGLAKPSARLWDRWLDTTHR